MHSSGMRTARLLTVSQHALSRGCLPEGVSAWGGVCQGTGGVLSRGCLPGSVCPGGCLPGAGDISQHAMGQTPPCGQTDICENITFANFFCGRSKCILTYLLNDSSIRNLRFRSSNQSHQGRSPSGTGTHPTVYCSPARSTAHS